MYLILMLRCNRLRIDMWYFDRSISVFFFSKNAIPCTKPLTGQFTLIIEQLNKYRYFMNSWCCICVAFILARPIYPSMPVPILYLSVIAKIESTGDIYFEFYVSFTMTLVILYWGLKLLAQLISNMFILCLYSLILDVSCSTSFSRNARCAIQLIQPRLSQVSGLLSRDTSHIPL